MLFFPIARWLSLTVSRARAQCHWPATGPAQFPGAPATARPPECGRRWEGGAGGQRDVKDAWPRGKRPRRTCWTPKLTDCQPCCSPAWLTLALRASSATGSDHVSANNATAAGAVLCRRAALHGPENQASEPDPPDPPGHELALAATRAKKKRTAAIAPNASGLSGRRPWSGWATPVVWPGDASGLSGSGQRKSGRRTRPA
jgi:hypothetical protein